MERKVITRLGPGLGPVCCLLLKALLKAVAPVGDPGLLLADCSARHAAPCLGIDNAIVARM